MGNQAVSVQQASEKLLNSNVTSQTSERQEQETEKVLFAYQRATMMYNCWRRDDAADPDMFIDSAAAILADYPEDVIVVVTDPRTGLAGKLKWPAQPSEVKEACDAILLPRLARQAVEEKMNEQLAERARLEALPKPKQTYEEFVAEMKARGLPIDGKPYTITDSVDQIKKRYGLTDEQWDAIPDLPAKGSDYWAGVRTGPSGGLDRLDAKPSK